MQPTTAEELATLALKLELVSEADLDAAWADLGGRNIPVEDLGNLLLRREVLTGYQRDRLLRGEQRGYFFGSAKILYQVGAGSFARVYRAVNVNDGTMLAVKVLRSRYTQDAEKCRWFRREGEMGRLVRHPNICAIEDVGQENNSIYITMEFVEGQTLRELVKIRGALDPGRAINLLDQMCAGLEYAHRRGMTHGDIKASNILISSLGQVKLVDFGLARIDADTADKALGNAKTDKGENLRTLDYATLEKLAGMKDDGIRSDIYFIGTMGYLALAGASALVESRDRAVRADPRRYTSVVPLHTRAPGAPRDIIDVINRMMILDPMERYQTVSDARRALEPLLEKHPINTAVTTPDRSVPTAPAGDAPAVGADGMPVVAAPKRTRAIMLVETSGRAQQQLKEFFGKLGFRVLLTENPQRALARFSTTPLPADCLVLSTQSLGEEAVAAFNKLTTDPFYAQVPAILLAGAKQREMAAQAVVDDRRRVLVTPFHTRDITTMLDELLAHAS
jgi:serine/threonine-protein kinase